jgi:hypothetical protein
MRIELRFTEATPVARRSDGMPVLAALARSPVELSLSLVNDGPGALQVESPHTSQGLLLWLTVPTKNETHCFMLNQTSIDATGELTAPLPVALELAPGACVSRSFDLCQVATPDHWPAPGTYVLAIEFLGVRSNELAFAIDQGGC